MGQRSAGAAAWAPKISLGLLLIAAAAQYTWNALTVTPLAGYDAGGHMGYVLTIVEEGRLPHPLEGWSTFHPPVYYLLGAVVWAALEPLGAQALGAGLRAISGLALLAVGCVGYLLVLRRDGDWRLASVTAALVLFLPVSAMSAAMLGNEALGAAWAALALPWILELQKDPCQPRVAALAALFAGLALATKYTGLFVVAACVVPFLRLDLDRRSARALMAGALVGAAVIGPSYARNLVLTGSPVPMTREREPMKSIEEDFVLRPREVADYLWIPARALRKPYLLGAPENNVIELNTAMLSVPGLMHASFWFDPFAHRIPLLFHRDGVWEGPLLAYLGLLPTAIMLLGFGLALADLVRRRGRSADAPLVVMCLVGLLAFVTFTWRVPSLLAVKGSYLLPLLAPAGLFFARGASWLPPRVRWPTLAACLATAVLAGLVFTNELFFPAETGFVEFWDGIGDWLVDPNIKDASARLAPSR